MTSAALRDRVDKALREFLGQAMPALDAIAPELAPLGQATEGWLLSKTRCWLTHLEALGRARRTGDSPERWS